MATLAAHLKVAPGATGKVRFIISWNYPNCANYWDPEKCTCGGSDSGSGGGSGAVSSSGSGSDNSKSNGSCVTTRQLTWKNYYTKLFHNSKDSASYCLKNWDRLYAATAGFRDALFSSTLPEEVLDAVSANISILKTPTCLRIEDGSFYAFEGCNAGSGCCPGSCTHVWNYAYALPFLFPSLERSMRDLDYKYNMRDDGSMSFRLRLPPGRERSAFRACADGQFGGVIKVYRDWKISGDDNWLREKWDAVRKSIDFAWAPTNEDFWDEGRDGVLKGRQHHTLDMELFGPNSWLTGFYLAALKAGAEMAAYLGENEKAAEYRSLFCKGKEWADKNLFNGEYYTQNIDLKDRSTLDRYVSGATLHGTSAGEAYWNEEAGEIKYQIGEGCIIDQVLAQWHANLCGLGEIFNRENVKKALASIYKYNFKKSMRGFYNPCRLFSLNDEAGTVICDWPEGRYKPVTPVPYAEETMCGFEYQAAAHMIQEGMVAEGIKLVKAVRDRFDGYKRNPWNEYECGSNYGRSMASYALLNAFSGFMFDAAEGMIGFNPVADKANASDNAINVINSTSDIFFRCFWSLDGGYGVFEHDPSEGEVIITITGGQLKLGSVILPFLNGHRIISVSLAGTTICCFEFDNSGKFTFKPHIYIGKNNKLEIKYC